MSRVPVRLRVTLAFAGAMAVLLSGLGLFIYLRYGTQLDNAIDQGLRSRADDVKATVQASGSLHTNSGAEPLAEPDEGFTQVISASGKVLDSTSQIGPEPVLDPSRLEAATARPIFFDAAPPPGVEGQVRVVATPAGPDGDGLLVVVGTSLDDRDEALRDLARLLLAGGPVALLLASLAGYVSIGAALRPVEAMRMRAAAIYRRGAGRATSRPRANDEIHRLGQTLNEMLARLETGLERERTFVDDASHELRTPLALLKTELEVALRYGNEAGELHAAVVSAREEVDRLIQLAEDLLVVARSEKGRLSIELGRVDVNQLLDDSGERFSARLAGDDRKLVIDSERDLIVEGDRRRLEQALTNLIDNALRHGSGDVTLASRAVDGHAEIHVRDQGPGFPPEFLPRAFERFSRADAGRAGGGSGFGLAIVAAIAEAHRGHARAANLAGGGADVWIDVPADAGR